MGRTEVRVAGFGGQGVVLAGVLLGTAAVLFDDKKAIQTQTYGAAARGGGARSDVIIDTQNIVYPRVTEPDIFVAMSEESIKKYGKELKKGGVLIIDEDLVKDPGLEDRQVHREVYRVPASRIAIRELGKNIVANLIMVGFLIGKTGLLSVEAVEEAIRRTVPRGTEELNLRAFRRGLEMAREAA